MHTIPQSANGKRHSVLVCDLAKDPVARCQTPPGRLCLLEAFLAHRRLCLTVGNSFGRSQILSVPDEKLET